MSRDTWEGVSTRPVSYNRWVYVSANPVNAVDPSGLYDGKKVHYQVTYDLAMAVTKLYPRPGSQFLPRLIATWDEYVDKGPTLNPVVGCVACHFMPLELAASRVEKVIFSGEPYLFGAALHQLQDSFSHWSEGYHDQTWGHAYHSVLAEMRDEDDLATFFANKPKASVIAEILDRNPGMTWETVLLKDDWEVVDLYLRADPFESVDEEKMRLRNAFGFSPDLYVETSWRDTMMRDWSSRYITLFVQYFIVRRDSCITPLLMWLEYLADGAPPTNEVENRIRSLLLN